MWAMARLAAAGAVGFAGAAGMTSMTSVASADTGGADRLSPRRIWPAPIVDEEIAQKALMKRIPNYFAEGQVSKDPTKGGIGTRWKLFKLVEKLPINHNTSKFIFAFDDPETEFSLPACSTMELGIKTNDGVGAWRLYTPTTTNGSKGGFEIVVKLYHRGFFTPKLFAVQEGDGVWARMKHLKLKYKAGDWDNIGLIAGGTGIAPMMQIIRTALEDPEDKARITLLYSNRRHRDVLLRTELDQLEKKHPDRFKVVHILQDPPLGWEGETGKISPAMVGRHLPPPVPKTLICVSGPDKMMETVAGCSTKNTLAWRNMGTGDALSGFRAKQPASPDANVISDMRGGLLYACGYEDPQVYRF